MLTNKQLQDLLSINENSLLDLNQNIQPRFVIESEKEVLHSINNLLARDSAAINFSAAGHYDFYRPVMLDAVSAGLPLLSCQDHSSSPANYLEIKQDLESKLAHLVGMPKVEITDECLVQALARVLLNLFHSTDDSSVRKNKLLLPSTLPPSLRLAVRTWLKYYSIETIVVGLDVSTGRVSFDQLEAIKADEVLAIIMSYPNFFGVLENVAEISAWAHQKGIKTIMVADALLLSYLKPPAQLTQNIDFTLCDLQPLGLPVHNKGTGPSLIAGSEHRFNDYSASYMKSAASISELMKIQVFFYSLAVEPLQHACRQANENLTQLVEQLLQIAGISLKFSVPVVNECVLHFEGIDLKRALQILAGHNILAGYPLGEDYPELDNCLLIHCTDQHDEAQIARLVDKITTVVKNLSAAACPVKPKFT